MAADGGADCYLPNLYPLGTGTARNPVGVHREHGGHFRGYHLHWSAGYVYDPCGPCSKAKEWEEEARKEREADRQAAAADRKEREAERLARAKEWEAARQERERAFQEREQASQAREQALQENRAFQQQILSQLAAEREQRDLMTARVLGLAGADEQPSQRQRRAARSRRQPGGIIPMPGPP